MEVYQLPLQMRIWHFSTFCPRRNLALRKKDRELVKRIANALQLIPTETEFSESDATTKRGEVDVLQLGIKYKELAIPATHS